MFDNLEWISPDPILSLSEKFIEDRNPRKVDLGIGLYKNSNGITPIMESVKIAEKYLVSQAEDKVYKGSVGLDGYCNKIISLLYKDAPEIIAEERVTAAQTVGGTGAVRLAAELIKSYSPRRIVWICDPTWENHRGIFSHLGVNIRSYPYLNEKGEFSFDCMIESISKIPFEDILVLHGCGHNPTGYDLTNNQWMHLLEIVKEKRIFPIIDMAYHGLADNLNKDSYGVNLFSEQLDEMFVAYSCSKNFGLYRDRVGALVILGKNKDHCSKIKLHASNLARVNYSSPPIHGASIVNEVLSSNELYQIWAAELERMTTRVKGARKMLVRESSEQGCSEIFLGAARGEGLFSTILLNLNEIRRLKEVYNIYMLEIGRINISGINKNNIEYVVSAIKQVAGTR
ncbi:aromatic amino acid transaminase [Billgrantia endophytica]|uniref:Aminotransferase n=1 Tax=Billgrantia endophytica TaxID=2033802 RepID=A0A2N7TX91_9GAMM|nr:aromatic amino acid transaminase [Halomonas endophytica]PMR72813.1 aromatic amino acid aminotransferase [Halomonas endophytica]